MTAHDDEQFTVQATTGQASTVQASTALTALVARQRQELVSLREQAAARSVVDLARGILMERLGCSAAAARDQLTRIAGDAGTPLLELAAEIAGERAAPSEAVGGPELLAGNRPHSAFALADAAMDLAEDGADLASALLDQTLAAEGAAAVAIWLTAPDGAVQLAGEAGFGPGEASRWQRLPPGMGVPGERAASTAAEFWWPAGQPEPVTLPLIGPYASGARAAVPLLTASGRCVGALEVSWPAAIGDFGESLRRQLRALANLAAHALTSPAHRVPYVLGLLGDLHESVLFAAPIRDERGAIVDFRIEHVSEGFRDSAGRLPAELAGQSLVEAYPVAALPGGLLHNAAQVATSGRAQHVTGEVLSTPGSSGQAAMATVRLARLCDGVAISVRHAAETDRLAALLQHAQRLGRFGGWEENLAADTVHWTEAMFTLFGVPADEPSRLADLHALVAPDDLGAFDAFRARLLRDKAPTAAVFRVVRKDDASIRQVRAFAEPVTDGFGDLVAVRGAYQDISAHYHTELALAATRDLLSDSEERVAEEHRLAMRLQRAITPQSSHLVQAAGLEVVARYRPAEAGHLVSGDWYDTVMLPTKQVMLAVGDVAGHGIDAVTGMVALRNCLRGLAITGAGPASLLNWLNGVACHLTEDILGTAICGLYDPVKGELRWARAGHLPAMLVRDGRASLLPQPQGVLLGADADACFSESTTPLQLGDTLLLFTDGLIERRGSAIDDCLQDMLTLASRPVTDLDEYADLLVTQSGSDTGDDACLLAVTLRLGR